MVKRKAKLVSAKKVSVSRSSVEKKNSLFMNVVLWFLGILLLGLLFVSLYNGMTGNVITGLAVSDPLASVFTSIIDGVKPVAEYLIGQEFDTSSSVDSVYEDFFAMSLLILLIVFSVVYVVLKKMSFFNSVDHVWVLWVVSISVSLLSIRFLSQEWLITILLPYSVLGVAISAGIPFVIFFLVVKDWSSQTARKLAWIFFSVIFIALYYARSTVLENIALAGESHYQIYLWTALVAFLMVLFDGTIKRLSNRMKHERVAQGAKGQRIQAIQTQIKLVKENSQNGTDSAYIGTTSLGRGKTGYDAYKSDMDFWQLELRKIVV